MKIAILDAVIRKNIALFKHLMRKQLEKQQKYKKLMAKIYHAFINRQSGELQFADLKEGKLEERDWKPVVIQISSKENQKPFEVLSEDGKDCFVCNDVSPAALRRLSETITMINDVYFDPKHKKGALKNLIFLEIEFTELEEGKRTLIRDAWHDVSREKAEKLLKNHPIGTYLLRRGECADFLEANLNQTYPEPVKCLTLTYSEHDGKVSDRIIIFKNGEWLFYNDDLELNGNTCTTLSSLLKSMGNTLKGPLRNG